MGTDKTSLGDRMKQYEFTSQSVLLRRTPIIIRVDGRAFHTFTKRFVAFSHDESTFHDAIVDHSLKFTPFSETMHNFMTGTAGTLFREIQTAAFVYTQSDEISIVLKDWNKLETQQWFDGNLQKLVSLSASVATAAFNFLYHREFLSEDPPRFPSTVAHFDARAFNLPKEEVVNYFIWRQQDAMRNSVQMYGRFFFSQKEMAGKSNEQVRQMLIDLHGVDWEDLQTWMKQGTAIYNRDNVSSLSSGPREYIDDECPIFTQDRNYIEKHLEQEQ